MKRILAALLMVVLAFSSVILLSSCATKPETDLEKAKDNLEDADYYVNYQDDMDDSEREEYLYAYNDDDFVTIVKFKDMKLAKLYYKQLKLEEEYENDYYDLRKDYYEYMLKKYDDELSDDEIEELEESLEELEEEMKDSDEYVIGRSGKIVWYGTKDAIKASKG